MMTAATRYYCTGCQASKFIPERPHNPPTKIRTGCNDCNRITTHRAWNEEAHA